ncbi:MAG: phosphoribosylanthranilate isomerase [Myxococcales bacterium]|nr:phosphoribosylanthranilate isomerase [Myxococcales bacterium]
MTSQADALACIALGVHAIGVNFWPATPRYCDPRTAHAIAEAVGSQATVVGVFVDETAEHVRELMKQTGIRWVQLHGKESPSYVRDFLPHAYKALAVTDAAIIDVARRYPGEHVLLDTYVRGMPGGTGQTFHWDLAKPVAQERKLTLAGGLNPHNVAEAVREVKPYRVDVASGVEASPGKKDLDLVRAFVQAVQSADAYESR